MKFRVLKKFFLMELKESYPGKYSVVFAALGILISTSIWWFTSRVVRPDPSYFSGDYFSYVIVGEVALLVPLALLTSLLRIVRIATRDGVTEYLQICPQGAARPLFFLGLMNALTDGLRAFAIVLLANVVFQLSVGQGALLEVLLIQIAGLLPAAGLAAFFSAVVVRVGRGDSLLPILTVAISLISGVWFPAEVFGERQAAFVNWLPFSIMMEQTRGVLSGSPIHWPSLIKLSIQGVFALLLGAWFFKKSLEFERKGRRPTLRG